MPSQFLAGCFWFWPPSHGHRSSSTCSAGKTFPAHKAELAPLGQSSKAPCGARPCSSHCCFSFPFPQINRPPQRETNIFVSKAGRTVRMACLPASRQGLDRSLRAMGSPAIQHKSLLTVLLLRRGAFRGAGVFAPCLFLSRKVTADACLPRETSLPDSSYPEQAPAWHSPRGMQGGPHFWISPCAPGLAGTPQGAKIELKISGLLLGLHSTELTPFQPNICIQQCPLGCSFQELAGGRAGETSPGCSPCLGWGMPRPEVGLGMGPAKGLSLLGRVYTTVDPVGTLLSL